MEKQIRPIPGLILISQVSPHRGLVQEWDGDPAAEMRSSVGGNHFCDSLDHLAGPNPYQGATKSAREGGRLGVEGLGGISQRWQRIFHGRQTEPPAPMGRTAQPLREGAERIAAPCFRGSGAAPGRQAQVPAARARAPSEPITGVGHEAPRCAGVGGQRQGWGSAPGGTERVGRQACEGLLALRTNHLGRPGGPRRAPWGAPRRTLVGATKPSGARRPEPHPAPPSGRAPGPRDAGAAP